MLKPAPQTSGWNSVYVEQIIEKIGPILAINNEEFTDMYVAENLIRDMQKIKKYYHFRLSMCNDVKKITFFLLLRKNLMVKIILKAIKKGASVIVCSKTVVSDSKIIVIKKIKVFIK